jgi:phage terminase large subunit-like protein
MAKKNLEPYKQYANDVLEGKIPACRYVKLACERYLSFFERDDMYFSPEAADRVVNFARKFKHVTGSFNGQPFELSDWQKWCVYAIYGFLWKKDNLRVTRRVYMEVARKQGKALSIDTPIPTPDGWKTMEDLKEGDRVYGLDGKPCTVQWATPVMYNHDCYKVTFRDGDTVIADADHEWLVKCHDRHGSKNDIRTLTTKELVKCARVRSDGKGTEYLYRIPMGKPVERPYADLPLDPYTLGFWLGDGHKSKPVLTINGDDLQEILSYLPIKTEKVFKYKEENAYRVSFCGDKGKDNSELRHGLEAAGVLHNKFVPENYINSGIGQRLALLQGFMDADGYCTNGECEFTQKSVQVTDGICEILSSLGVAYHRSTKTPTINGKVCDKVERVAFYMDKTFPCFRLNRKYNKLKDKLNKRMDWKSIISVEKTDSVPVKCIAVDSPDHLYRFGKRYSVTHNSSLVAILSLYALIGDREGNAEVTFASNSAKQASLCFKMASDFIKPWTSTTKIFKKYRDSIKLEATNSIMEVVSADASRLEGRNSSFFVCDELSQAPNGEVYTVLSSSQGMRSQPISMVITTASTHRTSFCFDLRQSFIDILEGHNTADNSFCAIYTLDDGDDPLTEDPEKRAIIWKKSNPNLGVTVQPEFLENELKDAKRAPALMASCLTRYFNLWLSTSAEWLPQNVVSESQKKWEYSDFNPNEDWGYGGVDLAAVGDLTCMSVMIPKNELFYYRNYYFLPHTALTNSTNKNLYRKWYNEGYLYLTPQSATDYDYILKKVKEINAEIPLVQIGYDPWSARQFINTCEAEGFNMRPYTQTIGNMSRGTKELARQMLNGRVVLYPNPIDNWCFENVGMKEDYNGNQRPVKGGSVNGKIDGIVAMVDAMGTYLELQMPSDYTVTSLGN